MARLRWSLLIVTLLLGIVLGAPARADVGGVVPGPGQCAYPGVGVSGMEFGIYHYECTFPVEVNGSRWYCVYGGAAATGTFGASLLVFNASIQLPLGVLEGICYWSCPDLSVAAQPNPPGGWNSRITPTKCKSIDPMPPQVQQVKFPKDPNAPPDPPPGLPPPDVPPPVGLTAYIVPQAPTPEPPVPGPDPESQGQPGIAAPDEEPGPQPPSEPQQKLPAVTNPIPGNPLETQNRTSRGRSG